MVVPAEPLRLAKADEWGQGLGAGTVSYRDVGVAAAPRNGAILEDGAETAVGRKGWRWVCKGIFKASLDEHLRERCSSRVQGAVPAKKQARRLITRTYKRVWLSTRRPSSARQSYRQKPKHVELASQLSIVHMLCTGNKTPEIGIQSRKQRMCVFDCASTSSLPTHTCTRLLFQETTV